MASAVDTARADIEGYLSSNITSIDATWDGDNIAWPGVDFEPPTAWIRPTILWGEGQMETMSTSGTNTITGVLVLSLFDRPGSGMGTLYGYADAARDLFDRANPGAGAVEFLAASGPRQVNTDDTRWLQVNLSIPFIVEETT